MTRPPQRIRSPSGRTTRSPSTQSRAVPYRSRRGPLRLAATSPPRVVRSPSGGSKGRINLSPATISCRRARGRPASTVTHRLSGSYSTTLTRRSRRTTTSSRPGWLPMPMAVPPPQGTRAAPAAAQAATTAATSSWVPGRTVRAGTRPSTAKAAVASWPISTWSFPTRSTSRDRSAAASQDMGHLLGDGEDLPGIGQVLGIEGPLHPELALDVRLRQHEAHGIHLLEAYAVLAADGPAQLDAKGEDFHACLHDPLLLLGIPPVEEDQRVQVPVARVEDVGNLQVVLLAHLRHLPQHGGQGGPRHRPVTDQVAGREARHGPEGAAPPGPQQGPLRVVLGDPHLPRPVLLAEADDGFALLLEVVLQSVDLDDEHRRAVQG